MSFIKIGHDTMYRDINNYLANLQDHLISLGVNVTGLSRFLVVKEWPVNGKKEELYISGTDLLEAKQLANTTKINSWVQQFQQGGHPIFAERFWRYIKNIEESKIEDGLEKLELPSGFTISYDTTDALEMQDILNSYYSLNLSEEQKSGFMSLVKNLMDMCYSNGRNSAK